MLAASSTRCSAGDNRSSCMSISCFTLAGRCAWTSSIETVRVHLPSRSASIPRPASSSSSDTMYSGVPLVILATRSVSGRGKAWPANRRSMKLCTAATSILGTRHHERARSRDE